MKYVAGTKLTEKERNHVLRCYVNRYTKEHKPMWAREKRPDGSAFMPQFSSDLDWLAHTEFAVKKDGRLDMKARYCLSHPTWPEGDHERKGG